MEASVSHSVNAFLNEDSGSLSNDEPDLSHAGDYSSHMEELFDEDTEGSFHGSDPYEDEEESFIYNGVDVVDTPAGYRERLLDVLGSDHNEDDGSEFDVLEVENSLVYDQHTDDEPLQHVDDIFSEGSPANSSLGPSTPPLRMSSPASYFKLARPFLHPNVSRLRSYTPQASRQIHEGSVASSHSHLFDGTSPSPSHFSSISRVSSVSNLQTASQDDTPNGETIREVFRWTELQAIMQTIYLSPKASGLLGSSLGRPTVLAANGLICTGTDDGKVIVHDFKQSLICICESNVQGSSPGAVTAVALSHDHTFVVSGHATGYITLYNLKNPRNPVRSVPPTTLVAVSTGRKEGHLQGSKIINIGFVAGRHTAIVSADDHGLAFFHSLGKILFVEASDILRILGRYPDDSFPKTSLKTPLLSSSIPAFSPAINGHQQRKSRYTVLAMFPLPLGTAPHPTDTYQTVALLTPTKLVVVGLKPTPRTWFKCPREVDEGGSWRSRSKWIGSMAWFPCVIRSSQSGPEMAQPGRTESPQNQSDFLTDPMLAYSWGSSLHIVKVVESRIKQVVKNPTTGKATEVEVGTLTYERFGQWSADDDIISLQWLNANQIIVVTHGHFGVYDLKVARLVEQITFKGSSLASPTADELSDEDPVAHSISVYKGKVFLLERARLVVGTLLTWADRVLSLVQDGDFLGAIDLVRSYYINEAPGNRNNLPDDPNLRKQMIGQKLRSLMEASTQYTFSEDRMTDSTHITPDNRGVDRTSLFEGLVSVCCRACVALDDFEFLFEDLFQRYDDSGISSIYLQQLEPFVLSNEIRHVPARITQKLVALHEKDGRPDHVERIIWHMDPSCLDLNQAIHICQQYHLYDALIYIYTRAMHDYVAPVVVLLGLIREIRRYRRSQITSMKTAGIPDDSDSPMEATIISAYKIYPYLANALSGLTYPSEDPLTLEESLLAKKDVYKFLFSGRSTVWPEGEGKGGKLVLTSDEEGGIEPTYPYVRQLLLFDSESFLHSLDIAFEDAYLNDKSLTINRLMIVRILLEILSSGSLLQEDVTLVHIFIARNVPKYPQFLEIAPTTLHSILVGLAEDPDPNTREDRQLAAEYLLSIYNPHESERVTELFETAGFFRILRTWYHHDRQWAKLLSTYIHDPDSTSLDLLDTIEETILVSSRANKGALPNELIPIVASSLPRLLDASIAGTAALIDKLIPELHIQALETFNTNPNPDKNRHEYLQSLLHPSDEEGGHAGRGHNVPQRLQQLFIALQCRFNSTEVIPTLQHLVKNTLDLREVLETCESNEVYDAVVWAINWQGDPQRALSKGDKCQKRISLKILETLNLDPHLPSIARELDSLQAIARISRVICLERSQGSSIEVPLEDMWFSLLNSQIQTVQLISGSIENHQSSETDPEYNEQQVKVKEVEHLLSSLRSLVQTTFSTLVTVTSTSAVSFPRLFKRLVNSTPQSTGSYYNEFRMILTGMLESYRSDEDLLIMLKHLVDRDLFDVVAQVTREQTAGWISRRETCQYCRKSLAPLNITTSSTNVSIHQIIVSRTGAIYHKNCKPPDALPC